MRSRSLLAFLFIQIAGGAGVWAQPAAASPDLIVQREAGGHLALNVENNALVLRFYDADLNQITPDAPRAMAFWRFRNKRNRQPLTLQGNALVSPQRIYPPFAYTINISLLTMEDNDVTESHNFDMRHFQSPAADEAAQSSENQNDQPPTP